MDKIIKQLVDRCREQFSYYDIVDENFEMVDYGSIIEFLFTEITGGVAISKMETVATDNNVGHKWIPARERKPTKEDADKYGRVLAMEYGMIALVNYLAPTNHPNIWKYWMPLPKPPKKGADNA